MTRYFELANDLRRRIAHGEFAIGAPLPGEHRLAEEYGASRGAVRNALRALETRGMVEPTRGNGWVVASQLQTLEFDAVRTFAEWAEAHGLMPGGLVVDSRTTPPSPSEVRVFRLSRQDAVLRVTRVRTLDARPVMLERTAYPPWVAPLIQSLPVDAPSVVRVMIEQGIRPVRGAHRIDAVAASSDDARFLGIARSSPLLRVRREYTNADGRVIETGDDRYLPGSISFGVMASAHR